MKRINKTILFTALAVVGVLAFMGQSAQRNGSSYLWLQPQYFTQHDKVCEANQFAGADISASINAAATSCGAMGVVKVQPGTYNVSTTMAITNGAIVECSGGDWKANGAGPLYHAACTLNWIGGASPVVSISGTAASGSQLKGFRISNSGTATLAVLIDNTQGILLEDISVDLSSTSPFTAFSTAGIQIGDTSGGHNVVDWTLRRVTVSGNPIGLRVLQTSGHGECYGCHIQHNTVQNVVLGSPTSNAISITFIGGTFEQDANLDSVFVQRASAITFVGSYWENLGTGCAINIPSTATLAQGVHVYGGWGSSFTTPANRFACVALSSAVISVDGLTMSGYTSPNYAVQNTAGMAISVVNSYMADSGAAVTDNFVNTYYCNNRVFNVNSGCGYGSGVAISMALGTMTWVQTPIRSDTGDSIIEMKSSGTSTPDWTIGTVVSSGTAGRFQLRDKLNAKEVFTCLLNTGGCSFLTGLSATTSLTLNGATSGSMKLGVAATGAANGIGYLYDSAGTGSALAWKLPAFSEISGVATPAQEGTGTPATGKYVDGGSGAWTFAHPQVTTAPYGYFVAPTIFFPATSATGAPISAGNQVRFDQIVLPFPATINTVSIEITTAVAATTCDVAIYSQDGTTRLVQTPAGFSAAVTGVFSATLGAPVTLQPGVYEFGFTCSNAGVSWRTVSPFATAINILNQNATKRHGAAGNSAAAGLMPSSLGTLTSASGAGTPLATFEP